MDASLLALDKPIYYIKDIRGYGPANSRSPSSMPSGSSFNGTSFLEMGSKTS